MCLRREEKSGLGERKMENLRRLVGCEDNLWSLQLWNKDQWQACRNRSSTSTHSESCESPCFMVTRFIFHLPAFLGHWSCLWAPCHLLNLRPAVLTTDAQWFPRDQCDTNIENTDDINKIPGIKLKWKAHFNRSRYHIGKVIGYTPHCSLKKWLWLLFLFPCAGLQQVTQNFWTVKPGKSLILDFYRARHFFCSVLLHTPFLKSRFWPTCGWYSNLPPHFSRVEEAEQCEGCRSFFFCKLWKRYWRGVQKRAGDENFLLIFEFCTCLSSNGNGNLCVSWQTIKLWSIFVRMCERDTATLWGCNQKKC